jgi:hypothetical protein
MKLARIVFAYLVLCSAAFAQVGQIPGWPPVQPASAAVIPLSLDGTPQFANASTASLALPAFTSSNSNDIILIPVISNGLPITSITGGSLTFARLTSFTPANNLDLWWAVAASPLSSVVFTVNTTGNAFITAGVLAVTGGKTSAPFDAVTTAQSTNPAAFATVTTDVANTFAIGMDGSSTNAPGSGWINVTSANFLTVNYQIFSTTVSGNVFDTANNQNSMVAAIVRGP